MYFVFLKPAFDDCDRVIGRAVVDDDEFRGLICLSFNTFERFQHILPLIVGEDDCTHHRIASLNHCNLSLSKVDELPESWRADTPLQDAGPWVGSIPSWQFLQL